MPAMIEAIEIKRKMYFEFENAPYHCLDVEVSRPTARGGQTLVRLKMRNLVTRAVFDKTFKAGDKFTEPDLVMSSATYSYADGEGCHFLDQDTFETLTLGVDILGDDRVFRVHQPKLARRNCRDRSWQTGRARYPDPPASSSGTTAAPARS